jgi:N-formylglutamate amidohydrolase
MEIILHIPHSSDIIPNVVGYTLSSSEIRKELDLVTDWYLDDLFDVENTQKIITPFSRLFCDVERFEDDRKEHMSKHGQGFFYTKTTDEKDLRKKDETLKRYVKKDYYKKHHNQFFRMVDDILKENKECLIIDCHSFSKGCLVNNKEFGDIDICIGADDYHTPKKLSNLLKSKFEALGYKTEINLPFSGAIVPIEYYNKNKKVKSVMIEVNKKLYIDGQKEKSKNYNKFKKDIQKIISEIKEEL